VPFAEVALGCNQVFPFFHHICTTGCPAAREHLHYRSGNALDGYRRILPMLSSVCAPRGVLCAHGLLRDYTAGEFLACCSRMDMPLYPMIDLLNAMLFALNHTSEGDVDWRTTRGISIHLHSMQSTDAISTESDRCEGWNSCQRPFSMQAKSTGPLGAYLV